MTLLWLIFWVAENTPALYAWNDWLVGLIVCIAIDAIGAEEAL